MFQENMQPNIVEVKNEGEKELFQVKSMLNEALKELEVKNQIIDKFNHFKTKIEEEKVEEISELE